MNKFQIVIWGLALLVVIALWISQIRQTRQSRETSGMIHDADRVAQDRRDVQAERDFDKNADDTFASEGGNVWRSKKAT